MIIGDDIPLSWIYALIFSIISIGVYLVDPKTGIMMFVLLASSFLAFHSFKKIKEGEKGLALALIGIIFFVLSVGLSGTGLKQVLFQGMTVLSISKAEFKSNSQFFNGDVWVLTITPNGMSQHLYGYFSPEEIYEKSGKRPEKGFTLDLTYFKQSAEYPIKVDYNSIPIYTLEYKEWTCLFPPSEQEAKNYCGIDTYIYGKYFDSYICYCIARHQESSYIGYLDNPEIHWNVKFKLCIDGGECKEKTFDSKGQISGYIGDIAYVRWVFSGLASYYTPYQGMYKAMYKDGYWKLISSEKYDSYKSSYVAFEDFINTYLGYNAIPISKRLELIEKVNGVNSRANDVLNTYVYFGDIVNKGNVYSAYVEYPMQNIVEVPTFTLWVKADKLGIYQPVPNIQIVDYSKEISFKTGERGYIWVKLRNDGERGTANIWIGNCYPITMAETTKSVTLESGEEKVVYIPVISGAKEEISKTCTVYVQEEVTGKIRTVNVLIKVHPQKVCNPGTKRCSPLNPSVIEICNDQGTGWLILKKCPQGYTCSYINGEPRCVSAEGEPEPTITCGNCFEWLRGKLAKLIGGKTVQVCLPKDTKISIFGITLFKISQDAYCPIIILIISIVLIAVLMFTIKIVKGWKK